jgi:GT2 family glycosyltransferase
MNDLVSIVIVNYNGKKYLQKCIESILKNSYQNFEIVVVDNNSSDGSVDATKEMFVNLQNLKIIKLEKNYGPSRARNEGVKASQGQIVCFLDNDTEVDEKFIVNAIKYFRDDRKIGILQCKLLLLEEKNRIDYAGEYLSQLGFLVHIAPYGVEDKGQYDKNYEILAAKSAGMFICRDVFDKIGGFDDDFFIFVEETDLGWRSWLSGFRAIFAFDSVVYHHFSTTNKIVDPSFNNYLVRFHGTKNYIMTLYKNLSFSKMIIILPKHILLWCGLAGYLLLRGNFNSSSNILKAIFWNIKNLKKNYNKRKVIQSKRVMTDKELFTKVYKNKGLMYYIKNYIKSQKLVVTTENQ